MRIKHKAWTQISQIWVSFVIIFSAFDCTFCSPAHYILGGLDQLLPYSSGAWGGTSSVVSVNPAGLAWVKHENRKSFGFSLVKQQLSLEYLARPQGVNISEDIYQAKAVTKMGNHFKPLPSQQLQTRGLAGGSDQQLYLSLNWSSEVFSHFYVGVSNLLPLHRFELQAPHFVDERAQYFGNQLAFERWGDTLEGMSTAVGLSYCFGQRLSIGLGLNVSTRSSAQSDVFLGDVNYDGISYVSPRVEVDTAISPFGSIEVRIPFVASELGIHVSAHQEESTDVTGSGDVQVWGFPYPEGKNSIPQKFKQVYRHIPMRFHSGMSWRHIQGLGFTIGLGWVQWSHYTNRAGEHAAWSDQWDVNLGATQAWGDLESGLDLRWRPSPVPEQIGRSNYIDPDQASFALSGRYKLTKGIKVQLQIQGHRLLPRLDKKDERALDPVVDEFPESTDASTGLKLNSSEGLQTNNPGYPGYRSEGWVWATYFGMHIAL